MDTCPLKMPRGTDAELDVVISLPGGIAGQAMTFAFYLGPNSDSPLFPKTTGGGEITLTSTAFGGIATVAILQADTLTYAPGTYFWALSRSDSGGHDAYSSGAFVLQPARAI
mgnify:CR=1 FL=1